MCLSGRIDWIVNSIRSRQLADGWGGIGSIEELFQQAERILKLRGPELPRTIPLGDSAYPGLPSALLLFRAAIPTPILSEARGSKNMEFHEWMKEDSNISGLGQFKDWIDRRTSASSTYARARERARPRPSPYLHQFFPYLNSLCSLIALRSQILCIFRRTIRYSRLIW